MISLTTQCPHCQARFKVNAPELQKRKGYVRCVDCAQIFDGYEQIIDEQGSAQTPAQFPNQDTKLAPTQTDKPTPIQPSTQDARPAPTWTFPAKPPATQAAEPTISVNEPSVSTDEPTIPTVEPLISTDKPSREEEQIFSISAESVESVAHTSRRPYRLPVISAGSENAQEQTDVTSEAVYGERRFEPAEFSWHQGLKKIASRVLILILIALTLLQTLYVFRAQLALYVPFARPALQAMCTQLGCKVPFLRAINAIQISRSRLLVQPPEQADEAHEAAEHGRIAGESHHYLLEIELHNNAQVAQEWPTLLVSFNDAAATVLGRYEVFPQTYLNETQLSGPFLPGQTVQIRLQVISTDKKINGFKVEKFFS